MWRWKARNTGCEEYNISWIRLCLHSATLENYASIFRVIEQVRPDECYHLAAQSSVPDSVEDEFSTICTNVMGTNHILASLKARVLECRFYFAGSSEMFGLVRESPQNEDTPFHPRSPYGISKVAGFHFTRNDREAYNTFACNGILFNHESPRRGHEFVTRKITRYAARIKCGLADKLPLGNLDARRDWGFAGDYVEAMWLMLQQDDPDDYVIATGKDHSVREFLEAAFSYLDLNYQDYVMVDQDLCRPAEVHELKGDFSKAEKTLDWRPKVRFEELVNMMVDADLAQVNLALPSPV